MNVFKVAGSTIVDIKVQDKEHERYAEDLRTNIYTIRKRWRLWLKAFQHILPVYIVTHIAFLILTYLANLFLIGDFSPKTLRTSSMLELWNRWDTGQFTDIAIKGYDGAWRTAFFPLYPLLEKSLSFVMHPYPAGLLIANVATLGLFTVFYRLVQEETSEIQAKRSLFYLAIFPTAFFFAAAYNESLFLLFVVSCIYQMRHSHWLLAGILGLFASLTRSAGVLLLLPFCYEYMRQRSFNIRTIRFGVTAGVLIPAGLGLFMLYCYQRFHDAMAFSHAQAVWGRSLQLPWKGYTSAWHVIRTHPVLSFNGIHNVMDMVAGLFMLVLVVLCCVGPWRFTRERSVYAVYAVSFYLFLMLFPATGQFPLQSLSRLIIEIFPAFIVLGEMGKNEHFNLYLITVSLSILAFMLLQFLTGRWMV